MLVAVPLLRLRNNKPNSTTRIASLLFRSCFQAKQFGQAQPLEWQLSLSPHLHGGKLDAHKSRTLI